MAMISNRYELPITSLADGTAIAVFNPFAPTTGFTNTGAALSVVPIGWVASGSSVFPYVANAISAVIPGPLQSQLANISTMAYDTFSIDYIHT